MHSKASEDDLKLNRQVHDSQNNKKDSSGSHGAEFMNICDVMSSFPSAGSHSVSNLLAKRPLEQVNNFASLAQRTQSMGFSNQANFKQVSSSVHRQTSAPGPGFFSTHNPSAQRNASRAAGTGLKANGEQNH